jgi:hypothetical protein
MKKISFLVFILLLTTSFNRFEETARIPETQLKFIKEKYKWDGEEILIINFTHKNENCFYNNNKASKEETVKWWKKYYSTIDLKNTLNIFVYSDKTSLAKMFDIPKCYEDYDDFLLKNFFNRKKECYGVLVINSIGEYRIKEGEYKEKVVSDFISDLKL